MPGLLPMFLAASQLVLVADQLPELNTKSSCHTAASAEIAISANRNENACLKDENDARDKLRQEWGQYTPRQKSHCVGLATLGGSPSYVEMLTCLELSQAADKLPAESKLSGQMKR